MNRKSAFLGAWLLLGVAATFSRAEIDPEVDQWSRSRTAGGRIRVVARDAVLMQQLSVWAARSLEDLEREWGLTIPVQADHPLIIQATDSVDRVSLQQEGHPGGGRQRIRVPGRTTAEDSRELARVFTRAMALRLMAAALPADAQRGGIRVPAWLELGAGLGLMEGRAGRVFAMLTADPSGFSPAYPEQIVRRERREVSPRAEAEAALFCRWLFGRADGTPAQKRELWTLIATENFLDPAVLMRQAGRRRDLRELHQHWDLWWQHERMKLTAEFRLRAPVLQALRVELRFLPGFYGLYREDLDRTRTISFEQLDDYLDDPGFPRAMARWSLRLQTLRFRQEPDLNDLITRFQQAVSTLAAASREKGKVREDVWMDALGQWREAEALLRNEFER